MEKLLQKVLSFSFFALLFFTPLVFLPFINLHTSELFEFNKMVLAYILTAIIVGSWLIRMAVERKIIFRRTILDIPLLIFLASQFLSTITSIDFRTSLLGFYSRFNGGLLSTLSYSLLYWAWVSNMDKEKTKKGLLFLLFSAVLVSLYGVLQHFGIDEHIWVQDVRNRVFSTLGQPNWLAAYLVALSPIAWAYFVKAKDKKVWLSLSALFFLVLLYTKSRSGLLAFIFSFGLFWAFEFWAAKVRKKLSIIKRLSIVSFLVFTAIILLVGTPWTKSIISNQEAVEDIEETTPQGPALETGGTESGEIRKIVWRGAVDIWKNYPLLGSGVETFGLSYYFFRPVEHNLVSEWDFLYNKAHNEYLNVAATTGTLGLTSYLLLVGSALFLLFKEGRIALLTGYVSILITNFFGFSVVSVSTLFFLFPAFAVSLRVKTGKEKSKDKSFSQLYISQKALVLLVFLSFLYVFLTVSRYWYADIFYTKGKNLKDSGSPVEAREELEKAIKLSGSEAIFWNELSKANTDIAIALAEGDEIENAEEFASQAIMESDKALSLSPKNVNLFRDRASMFIRLSSLDNNYLLSANQVLLTATNLAPTDAKLFYNLGLTQARIGNTQDALTTLKKTVEMKSDYRNARFALAILLAEEGERVEAISHLEYILELNPEDALVRQQLEEYR